MKTRKLKIFALALTLPLLTGCKLIHNFICGIALNVAFNSPDLLSKVNVVEGGAKLTPIEDKPTSADKRASLTYGIEALVLPKRIETVQYGYEIIIDFTFTFSEGAQDYFIFVMSKTHKKVNIMLMVLFSIQLALLKIRVTNKK